MKTLRQNGLQAHMPVPPKKRLLINIFSELHYLKNKPEACQPLAGGYTSLPGTVFRDSGTLVPGNERHHRTESR
jgi:hypothetical protein